MTGGFIMTDVSNRDSVKRGEGVNFERIRRITGYLVGTLDRFGDGKRAEEADRVKHSTSCSSCDVEVSK